MVLVFVVNIVERVHNHIIRCKVINERYGATVCRLHYKLCELSAWRLCFWLLLYIYLLLSCCFCAYCVLFLSNEHTYTLLYHSLH